MSGTLDRWGVAEEDDESGRRFYMGAQMKLLMFSKPSIKMTLQPLPLDDFR